MEIKVYSNVGCTKCVEFKNFLKDNSLEFEEIIDIPKAIELGQKYNIRTLPIVAIDDEVLNFNDAKEYIKNTK